MNELPSSSCLVSLEAARAILTYFFSHRFSYCFLTDWTAASRLFTNPLCSLIHLSRLSAWAPSRRLLFDKIPLLVLVNFDQLKTPCPMELGTMTGRNWAWPENYESSFIYQQYVGLTVNKISHFIVRCSSQEPSLDGLILSYQNNANFFFEINYPDGFQMTNVYPKMKWNNFSPFLYYFLSYASIYSRTVILNLTNLFNCSNAKNHTIFLFSRVCYWCNHGGLYADLFLP